MVNFVLCYGLCNLLCSFVTDSVTDAVTDSVTDCLPDNSTHYTIDSRSERLSRPARSPLTNETLRDAFNMHSPTFCLEALCKCPISSSLC